MPIDMIVLVPFLSCLIMQRQLQPLVRPKFMRCGIRVWILFFSVAGVVLPTLDVLAFLPPFPYSSTRFYPRTFRGLCGIAEWRAQCGHQCENAPTHGPATCSIPMLPLAPSQALLPGQTSGNIILKEGRWFDLLDEAVEDHCRVVGTSLMGPDGLLPVLPLCEIDHYELSAGYRGKVTASIRLRGVGRAQLLQLEQVKPFMVGRVQELYDERQLQDDGGGVELADILRELETLVQDCGRLEDYKSAYRPAREITPGKKQDSSHDRVCSAIERLEAASWAATSLALPMDPPDNMEDYAITKRYQALETVNAMERLRWAMTRLEDAGSFQ